MKKMFLIVCALSIEMVSCGPGSGSKANSDSNHPVEEIRKDTIRKAETVRELTQFTVNDCNHLLNRLFQGSSFKSAFAKSELVVSVNGVKDSVVSIQVETKESDNLTVGWINLDLRKREMADITNDSDAPVILKCNKSMLDSLLTGCTFTDTE